ncbi:MAG: hypothetical protein GC153_07520 [Alphaproteobacteria bacterium]|nr:hypothetical protein [Alphaproteobacteria bacterium]
MKKIIIFSALAAAGLIAGGALAQGGQGPRDKESRWERLDANGDGKITLDELDARQKAFLAEADANGDGVLTKDELKAVHDKRRAERAALMMGDANGDGKVTREEFEAREAARFAKLDTNKDGVLSPDELAAAPRGPRHGKHDRR